MVRKKKSLIISLFMFFAISFGLCLGNTCKATTRFDFTAQDLMNIWTYCKNISIDIEPANVNSTSVADVWAYAEENSGDRNWTAIANDWNTYLNNQFSGDLEFNDDQNFIIWCLPERSGVSIGSYNGFYFCFIPELQRTVSSNEVLTSYTYSGQTRYYYQENLSICNYSGEITAPYNMLYLLFVPRNSQNSVDMKRENNNAWYTNGFKNFYKSKYSWRENEFYTYGYGLVGTYRSNNIPSWKYKSIYYSPYDSSTFSQYRLHYRYDLDTENFTSGDDTTPVPTSSPSGDDAGGVDLTETNDLITDINSSLTDVPGSGDFDFPSSGEIVGAFNDFQISDPTDNFWSFLVTGLQASLTNDVRYLEFDFLGETYILDNQAYSLTNIPLLYELVTTACIVGFIVVEFGFIHHLVVYISTLDLDIILKRLRSMDISDIFR